MGTGHQCSKELVDRGAGSCPQAGHQYTVVPGVSVCVLVAGRFEAGLPRLSQRLRLRWCLSPAPASMLLCSSGLLGSGSAVLELGKAAGLSRLCPDQSMKSASCPGKAHPTHRKTRGTQPQPRAEQKMGLLCPQTPHLPEDSVPEQCSSTSSILLLFFFFFFFLCWEMGPTSR